MKDVFEVRQLDKCWIKPGFEINRQSLFEMIPQMLVGKYTVVIMEQFQETRTTEVTAVHLPVQSQLTIPPIIQ